MKNSSLHTVSVAKITGTIFETPNNQGKNSQPRIAVVSVYFASYDSVCDKDSTFQKRIKANAIQRTMDFLCALIAVDITPLHS